MKEIITRTCTKCLEEFPATTEHFYKNNSGRYGLQSKCKTCVKQYDKQRYQGNIEQFSARNKQYYSENAEAVCEYVKQYNTNRLKTDRKFNMLCKLRRILRDVLNGKYKTDRTCRRFFGCSVNILRWHFENQFYNRADATPMTWENYGFYGWHIDHKTPCSHFNLLNPEEQKECFSWTNLQPLWAEDNMAKGNRTQNEWETLKQWRIGTGGLVNN